MADPRGRAAKPRGKAAKARGKAAEPRGKAAKSPDSAATPQEKVTQAVAALACVLDGGAAADNRDTDSGQHFRDMRTHLARVAG